MTTKKKLSEIDDPTIINIEVTLFCGDSMVLRDTTWLKNIEDLVELFNHLEKNSGECIFKLFDNPIQVRFVRYGDIVKYTIYTLDDVYDCEIPFLDLVENVSSTVRILLEFIIENSENLRKSSFINRLLNTFKIYNKTIDRVKEFHPRARLRCWSRIF